MIVKNGQSVFDITTQEFGTLEELFTLLVDNDLNANSKLISGQELIINKIGKGEENIKSFITLGGIVFNNDQGKALPPVLSGDYNNDYSNDYF